MVGEDLMRLVAMRGAVKKARRTLNVPAYGTSGRATTLLRQLEAEGARRREGGRHVEIGREFQRSASYVRKVEDVDFRLPPLLRWAVENASVLVDDADLPEFLRSVYGSDAASLAASDEFRQTGARLADTLLSDSLAPGARTPARDEVVMAIKLMSLIERIGRNADQVPEMTVGAWLQKTVVVLPGVAQRPGFPPARPDDDEAGGVKAEPSRPDTTRLTELETARDELLRAASRVESFEQPPAAQPSEAERRLERLERRLSDEGVPQTLRRTEGERAAQLVRPALTRSAIEALSPTTRRVLAEMRLNTARLDPFRALADLDDVIKREGAAVFRPENPPTVLLLSGATLDLQLMREAVRGTQRRPGVVDKALGCGFEAGVGDLLVVRQTLKAYELADFAHVENVLAGESREREHRRLTVREETLTTETETETQKERDLQSTERSEMQTEIERTVKSEFGLDAGLQLSGSYGPTVSFSSSLSLSFSTSTEETERRAASLSREITEKTAERTRERLREEHQRRTLEQIEELNRHKVDNSEASNGHVRGIYRWLNKVYDAQVFNYGQRMMFEFIIPEPAAYFLWAIIENPPNEAVLVKPTFPIIGGRPLTAADLTASNVQMYLTRLQVTDAPPYPPSSLVVSHFDAMDDTGQSKGIGRGVKIGIPAGYNTTSALLSGANSGPDLDDFNVLIGGGYHMPLEGMQKLVFFQYIYAGEISVVIYGGRTRNYTVGIDLFCWLNETGIRKWQQQTFEAILRAYQTRVADYEEKLAAQQIRKGIQILGRNPLENRRIERDELRKLAISMLTDDSDPSLDAFVSEGEPVIDVEAACAAGARIRFFENAFEWRNMTYVLYPYFWGRKARWVSALHLTDPDPDFAAFLKAGAARVQVPVRPGFESAIAYYCQTGKIWNGGDPPLIDDELYVPIVEEISESLGKLEDGVPYPKESTPWEVRIPTSLVLVQNLEEIPGIRDALTNQETNILPPAQ